jgi:hypothetical protein
MHLNQTMNKEGNLQRQSSSSIRIFTQDGGVTVGKRVEEGEFGNNSTRNIYGNNQQ